MPRPPSPVSTKGALPWAVLAPVHPAHCDWGRAYPPLSCWQFQDTDKTALIFKFSGLSTWEVLQKYLSAPGVNKWSTEVGMACSWDSEGVSVVTGEHGA